MTEEQREKAFPVHIELGHEAEGIEMSSKGIKKGKKRTIYPSLYIGGVDGIDEIPEEGCMLVHFKRRNLTVNKNDKGESNASVDLEIHTICLEEESDEDHDDIIDKMYKKSQRKVGDYEEDEDKID